MEIQVRYQPNLGNPVESVQITIGFDTPERQGRPTEEDLALCPDTFTCYVCEVKQPRKMLGGVTYGQRLCRCCYPYVDEFDVRCLVRWDARHGYFQLPGDRRLPVLDSQTSREERDTRDLEIVWVELRRFSSGDWMVKAIDLAGFSYLVKPFGRDAERARVYANELTHRFKAELDLRITPLEGELLKQARN